MFGYGINMSLLKNAITFSGFTFISRILGFIRDMLIAYKLGTTALADVFFIAFRIPNMFRSLFAEGAFSSAFIPIYSKNKDKHFVNNMFTILLVTLIIFCMLMQIIMPFFLYIITPGFIGEPSKFDTTVFLSRVMFPYLISISLVALLGGVMQAQKKFAAIAMAPIILNISMIVGLTYLTQYTHILYALSFSIVIAGLLQLLLLLSAVARTGHTVTLGRFILSEDIKLFFRRLIPAVLGAGIIQVSTMIDTFFASTIPGAVSYLYYADRVIQLPLALIGISIGNALLPRLSQQASDIEKVISTQNKAIKLGFILCIPAAAAAYTLANTTITCLFAYGSFSIHSIEQTANALKAFATALPAFVLYKILINNYFARGNTKTPALTSLLCLSINIILNFILIRYYQHVGIIIATSISNWLNVIILLVQLRFKKLFKFDSTLDITFAKILISTALMLFAIQIVDIFLQPLILGPISLKLFVISSITIIGIATYFGSFYLISKIKYLKT